MSIKWNYFEVCLFSYTIRTSALRLWAEEVTLHKEKPCVLLVMCALEAAWLL